jgi:propanol-preferring alcohol dehydrogenase
MGETLVAVSACGVCRTDLHVVDGELPHPKLPIVHGHEGPRLDVGTNLSDIDRADKIVR